MRKHIVGTIIVGGLYLVGGVIIHKLDKLQEEITHIEDYKYIPTKKQHEAQLKAYWERVEEEEA